MKKTLAILFTIAFCCFCWLIYHATGTRFNGHAATPKDIPIVGERLNELVLTEPTRYHGYEHPHGGGTFTITGVATPESVAQFCDVAGVSLSHDGTDVWDRDKILDSFEQLDTGIADEQSCDVMFGMGARFRIVLGIYDMQSHRFVLDIHFDSRK